MTVPATASVAAATAAAAGMVVAFAAGLAFRLKSAAAIAAATTNPMIPMRVLVIAKFF